MVAVSAIYAMDLNLVTTTAMSTPNLRLNGVVSAVEGGEFAAELAKLTDSPVVQAVVEVSDPVAPVTEVPESGVRLFTMPGTTRPMPAAQPTVVISTLDAVGQAVSLPSITQTFEVPVTGPVASESTRDVSSEVFVPRERKADEAPAKRGRVNRAVAELAEASGESIEQAPKSVRSRRAKAVESVTDLGEVADKGPVVSSVLPTHLGEARVLDESVPSRRSGSQVPSQSAVASALIPDRVADVVAKASLLTPAVAPTPASPSLSAEPETVTPVASVTGQAPSSFAAETDVKLTPTSDVESREAAPDEAVVAGPAPRSRRPRSAPPVVAASPGVPQIVPNVLPATNPMATSVVTPEGPQTSIEATQSISRTTQIPSGVSGVDSVLQAVASPTVQHEEDPVASGATRSEVEVPSDFTVSSTASKPNSFASVTSNRDDIKPVGPRSHEALNRRPSPEVADASAIPTQDWAPEGAQVRPIAQSAPQVVSQTFAATQPAAQASAPSRPIDDPRTGRIAVAPPQEAGQPSPDPIQLPTASVAPTMSREYSAAGPAAESPVRSQPSPVAATPQSETESRPVVAPSANVSLSADVEPTATLRAVTPPSQPVHVGARVVEDEPQKAGSPQDASAVPESLEPVAARNGHELDTQAVPQPPLTVETPLTSPTKRPSPQTAVMDSKVADRSSSSREETVANFAGAVTRPQAPTQIRPDELAVEPNLTFPVSTSPEDAKVSDASSHASEGKSPNIVGSRTQPEVATQIRVSAPPAPVSPAPQTARQTFVPEKAHAKISDQAASPVVAVNDSTPLTVEAPDHRTASANPARSPNDLAPQSAPTTVRANAPQTNRQTSDEVTSENASKPAVSTPQPELSSSPVAKAQTPGPQTVVPSDPPTSPAAERAAPSVEIPAPEAPLHTSAVAHSELSGPQDASTLQSITTVPPVNPAPEGKVASTPEPSSPQIVIASDRPSNPTQPSVESLAQSDKRPAPVAAKSELSGPKDASTLQLITTVSSINPAPEDKVASTPEPASPQIVIASDRPSNPTQPSVESPSHATKRPTPEASLRSSQSPQPEVRIPKDASATQPTATVSPINLVTDGHVPASPDAAKPETVIASNLAVNAPEPNVEPHAPSVENPAFVAVPQPEVRSPKDASATQPIETASPISLAAEGHVSAAPDASRAETVIASNLAVNSTELIVEPHDPSVKNPAPVVVPQPEVRIPKDASATQPTTTVLPVNHDPVSNVASTPEPVGPSSVVASDRPGNPGIASTAPQVELPAPSVKRPAPEANLRSNAFSRPEVIGSKDVAAPVGSDPLGDVASAPKVANSQAVIASDRRSAPTDRSVETPAHSTKRPADEAPTRTNPAAPAPDNEVAKPSPTPGLDAPVTDAKGPRNTITSPNPGSVEVTGPRTQPDLSSTPPTRVLTDPVVSQPVATPSSSPQSVSPVIAPVSDELTPTEGKGPNSLPDAPDVDPKPATPSHMKAKEAPAVAEEEAPVATVKVDEKRTRSKPGEEKSVDPAVHASDVTVHTRSTHEVAPTEAVRQTRVDTHAVLREVANRIELLAATRNRDGVVVHLDPKDLGQITLRVKPESGGGMTAEIGANNEQVRQALERNQPQLLRQVEQRGVHLTQVSISSDTGRSGEGRSHYAPHAQPQNFGHAGTTSSRTSQEVPLVPSRRWNQRTSGVDLSI